MTPEAHHVQVEIFGQTYKLRAEDDPSYVESLAAVVDGKMREIARQTNAVDSLRVAILAALNIADEARRGGGAGGAPGTRSAGSAAMDRRLRGMVTILDEALAS